MRTDTHDATPAAPYVPLSNGEDSTATEQHLHDLVTSITNRSSGDSDSDESDNIQTAIAIREESAENEHLQTVQFVGDGAEGSDLTTSQSGRIPTARVKQCSSILCGKMAMGWSIGGTALALLTTAAYFIATGLHAQSQCGAELVIFNAAAGRHQSHWQNQYQVMTNGTNTIRNVQPGSTVQINHCTLFNHTDTFTMPKHGVVEVHGHSNDTQGDFSLLLYPNPSEDANAAVDTTEAAQTRGPALRGTLTATAW